MDLSVIVVNWNVRELLRACLISLREHAPAGVSMRVHVVDNASSDGSAAMVREEFPEVDLLACEENLGFARGNNLAFSRCEGRFILLLNPDARVLPGALDALLAAMAADDRLGVAGAGLIYPDGAFQRGCGGAMPTLANVACHSLGLDRALPNAWRPPSMFFDQRECAERAADWVSGAAMLLRREALDGRIFDERFFMYAEDMDLCHRAARRGWRIGLVPEACVVHHMSASMRRQDCDVVYSSLVRGPRTFFRSVHGPVTSLVFDVVVLTGYVIRWLTFSVRTLVRPGAHHAQRAAENRRAALAAVRVMLGR